MENLEMYKIVATNCKGKGTSKCTSNCRDCATEALYAAGYRPELEVRAETAKEIFGKIGERLYMTVTAPKEMLQKKGYSQVTEIIKILKFTAAEYGVDEDE